MCALVYWYYFTDKLLLYCASHQVNLISCNFFLVYFFFDPFVGFFETLFFVQNKAVRAACQAHNLDVIGSNPIFATFFNVFKEQIV
jgi:hypothetical protein